MGKGSKALTLIAGILVLIVAAAGAAYMALRDSVPPEVRIEGAGKTGAMVTIRASDTGSGVGSVEVFVAQGGQEKAIFSRRYPPGQKEIVETPGLSGAGLKSGEFRVRAVVRDVPKFGIGEGNAAEVVATMTFDTIAPEISIRSDAHNINQGGSAIVVYGLNEPVSKTGVIVGSLFFPGFEISAGQYAAFFAFPQDMSIDAYKPVVTATDLAGNERKSNFPYHLRPKAFRHDTIEVSDAFLEKVMPQFEVDFPDVKDRVELFLKANRDLRARNAEAIMKVGQDTVPKVLWSGPFSHVADLAREASFADRRTYMHGGRQIDTQTHLGYDFASLKHAPVVAAENGRVVFAERLGIYGQCVILDHGLGLQSLYGHMSEITVKKGDEVRRGQALGRSGETGMAGGDHLHFGVYISGVAVNPLEWFDAHWIRDNVAGKLGMTVQAEEPVKAAVRRPLKKARKHR